MNELGARNGPFLPHVAVFAATNEEVDVPHQGRQQIDPILIENGEQKFVDQFLEVFQIDAKQNAKGRILNWFLRIKGGKLNVENCIRFGARTYIYVIIEGQRQIETDFQHRQLLKCVDYPTKFIDANVVLATCVPERSDI